MSSRFKLVHKNLEGTPLADGKHSTSQDSLGRTIRGERRAFGNPNSKVAKLEKRKKRKEQEKTNGGGSEINEF